MTSAHNVFVMLFISLMMALLCPSTAQGIQFGVTSIDDVDGTMYELFGDFIQINTRTSPSSCTTPRQERGQCSLLSQCSHYLPLFREIHDEAVLNFFRSSICRVEMRRVLICCPENPQQMPPTLNTSPNQPGHINFGESSGRNPSQNLPVGPTQNFPSQPSFPNSPVQTTTPRFPQATTGILQGSSNRNPAFQIPQTITNQSQSHQTLPQGNVPGQGVSTQNPQVGVSFASSTFQPDRLIEQVSTTPHTQELLPINIPLESECGRIILSNGESTSWPWLAAVGFLRNGFIFDVLCGGALITRRHVITAAHCIDHNMQFGKPTHVRLGDYDLGRSNDVAGPQDFDIAGYQMAGFDNRTFAMDLAIITLSKDVLFDDFIQPVCLPFRFRYDGFRYQALQVIGWRQTITTKSRDDLPKTHHDYLAQVIGLDKCSQLYRKLAPVTVNRRNVCAAGDGQETCLRDIGAPALYLDDVTTQRYYLAGIASFGFGCERSAEPYIYTRIGAFLDWIKQNLE